VPISTLVDSVVKVAPLLSITPAIPVGDLSFNLAPGARDWRRSLRNPGRLRKQLAPPLSLQTSFQGNAQAFGASLQSTPILIVAALFVIYLPHPRRSL